MAPSHKMSERDPYPSPGRCIYCLEEAPKLTDEHMVPQAFNGTWYIQYAACDPCRERTNTQYEGKAINCDMLRVPRAILELSRSKNSRKKGPLPIPPVWEGDVAGQEKMSGLPKIELDAGEYPPLFTLLVIEPADQLLDAPSKRDTFRVWMRNIESGKLGGVVVSDETELNYDMDKDVLMSWAITKGGKQVTARQRFAQRSYAMMIAKIGYCFAVAERGLEGFDGSAIRDLLAGKRNDVYNFVGGSLNGERLTDRNFHHLTLRERGKLLTVIVHLFASYGAPPYEVVVGSIE